ncbi:MAG: hypothetical protein NVSMB42_00890 [Herpetosiphon sp.]
MKAPPKHEPLGRHPVTDVTLKNDDAGYVGLIMRYTDDSSIGSGYVCLISNNSKFFCSKLDKSNGTPFAPAQQTDAIKVNGKNNLVMAVNGNKIEFVINDNLVGTYTDDSFKSGSAGFYIENFESPYSATFGETVIGSFDK